MKIAIGQAQSMSGDVNENVARLRKLCKTPSVTARGTEMSAALGGF